MTWFIWYAIQCNCSHILSWILEKLCLVWAGGQPCVPAAGGKIRVSLDSANKNELKGKLLTEDEQEWWVFPGAGGRGVQGREGPQPCLSGQTGELLRRLPGKTPPFCFVVRKLGAVTGLSEIMFASLCVCLPTVSLTQGLSRSLLCVQRGLCYLRKWPIQSESPLPPIVAWSSPRLTSKQPTVMQAIRQWSLNRGLHILSHFNVGVMNREV